MFEISYKQNILFILLMTFVLCTVKTDHPFDTNGEPSVEELNRDDEEIVFQFTPAQQLYWLFAICSLLCISCVGIYGFLSLSY